MNIKIFNWIDEPTISIQYFNFFKPEPRNIILKYKPQPTIESLWYNFLVWLPGTTSHTVKIFMAWRQTAWIENEIYLKCLHVNKLPCVISCIILWGKCISHISQDLAAAVSFFIITVLKSEGTQNYTITHLKLASAKIKSQFLSQQEIAMHWWVLGYGTILKESRFITST